MRMVNNVYISCINDKIIELRMLKSLLLSLAIGCCFLAGAQPNTPSTHATELAHYRALYISPDEWQHLNERSTTPTTPKTIDNCTLQKRVFGWHPYWSNGLEQHYDWSLLSDLSYFAYEVNATTGQAINTYNWASAPVVTQAIANGVKVHLCVTLFSNHATFFGNASARQTLITNLINLVQQRGAHGVNIDFEAVPAAQSANLTAFMIALSTQLKAAMPQAELSMAIPAVDWSAVFNVSALHPYVDLFIIMGYDYYWGGSAQAGPTDPLYAFSSAYNYNLSRSISYYLHAGAPRNKVLLGLPYYGREWETQSNTIPANTTGNFHASRTYKAVRDNPATYANRAFHTNSVSSYFSYPSGSNWRQCFINAEQTLARRYQLALQRGLAGIGIWALGYDAGYSELWTLLRNHFTDCAVQACTDTLYDGGGPGLNYYNNENYTFTIAPQGAITLSLDFQSFHVESGFDTLWIYDGNSTAAPLLGAWSGTQSPGNIQASGNSLTLRFKSDVSGTAPGWVATYSCMLSDVQEAADTPSKRPVLYPNPAQNGSFTVRHPGPLQLDIYDVQGRIISRQASNSPDAEHTIQLQPGLHGLFLVSIRQGQAQWTERLLLLPGR
jgi:spore germination protein YaaH